MDWKVHLSEIIHSLRNGNGTKKKSEFRSDSNGLLMRIPRMFGDKFSVDGKRRRADKKKWGERKKWFSVQKRAGKIEQIKSMRTRNIIIIRNFDFMIIVMDSTADWFNSSSHFAIRSQPMSLLVMSWQEPAEKKSARFLHSMFAIRERFHLSSARTHVRTSAGDKAWKKKRKREPRKWQLFYVCQQNFVRISICSIPIPATWPLISNRGAHTWAKRVA